MVLKGNVRELWVAEERDALWDWVRRPAALIIARSQFEVRNTETLSESSHNEYRVSVSMYIYPETLSNKSNSS